MPRLALTRTPMDKGSDLSSRANSFRLSLRSCGSPLDKLLVLDYDRAPDSVQLNPTRRIRYSSYGPQFNRSTEG